jgi:hypothetical protein
LCPGRKTSRNWSKPIKWCAFLFNMKIVYTARWRLFATPDTPCFEGAMIKLRFPSGFLNLSTTYFEIYFSFSMYFHLTNKHSFVLFFRNFYRKTISVRQAALL